MLNNGDVFMTVHADYTQPCYTIKPDFKHKRIKNVLGITQYICNTLKEEFGVDANLCYNPLIIEPNKKRITLVSATRLSAIKGGKRMKALADALDSAGINYIWYVFTNDNDCIGSNNVIFMKPRLDVHKWIAEADYLVQLSDTEACSYSIVEALSYGTGLIVTPLPYLNELQINETNALILNFDLSNINEIVAQIKNIKKFKWEMPADNYNNYFVDGKSKFKEAKSGMKLIKVKNKFKDALHNNMLRRVGEEFEEKDERAQDLINRGFCVLIADIKEKTKKAVNVVETAVKEVKKEKAIKEKIVKKNAKK